MQKFKTKVLSVLLTMCMLVGMLQPMGALVVQAAEATNVAQDKTVTTNASFVNNDCPLDRVVDNNTTMDSFGEFGADRSGATYGEYYVQIDFGNIYDVTKVELFRYFDGRSYDATVVALAETEEEFTAEDATVVYNSDVGNKYGFGAGADETYEETAEGNTLEFNTVAAQYVRIYMCGVATEGGSKNNHIVECKVWGVPHETTAPEPTPDPEPTPIESSKIMVDSVNGTFELSGVSGENPSVTNDQIKEAIFDGDNTSFWTSAWVAGENLASGAYYVMKLDGVYSVDRLDYTPRWHSSEKWACTGNIKNMIVEVKENETDEWTVLTGENGVNFGDLVVKEGADPDAFPIELRLEEAVDAQYIRIRANDSWNHSGMNGQKGITISELDIYGTYKSEAPTPEPGPETPDPTPSTSAKIEKDQIRSVSVSGTKETASGGENDTDATSAEILNDIYDGNAETFWNSNWVNSVAEGNPYLTIKLNGIYKLDKVEYAPRWHSSEKWACTGNIKKLVVEISEDGTTWTTVTPDGGADFSDKINKNASAATADFPYVVEFDAQSTGFVRISATESYHWDLKQLNTSITIGDVALYGAYEKDMPVDRSELTAAIAEAAAIEKGAYTDATWNALQTALTAAREVGTDATQAAVDTATANLKAAIAGLQTPKPLQNANAPLDLPTFDAPGKIKGETHPDMLYFENGWHGYKYFMAVTPNQNGNSQFENPYILVSNNGTDWDLMPDLTAPLTGVKEEPHPYHNCDEDLVYNEATNQIYLYYNWVDDADSNAKAQVRLFIIGYDETKEEFYSVSGETPICAIETDARYDALSTSIVVKEGKWEMWAVDTHDGGNFGWNTSNTRVEYRTSDDGINWSEETSLEDTFTQPGYDHWHIDVQWVPKAGENGEYWAIYPAWPKPDGNSQRTWLFFAKSTDGQVWTTYEEPILSPRGGQYWDRNFIYRSTFLYEPKTDLFRVWYASGYTGNADPGAWAIGYTENDFSDMIASIGKATTATATPPAKPQVGTIAATDFTALNNKITTFKNKYKQADYTEASWALYAEGLALAEATAANTNAKQAVVDALVTELTRVEKLLVKAGSEPVPGTWTIIDDADSKVTYSGTWKTQNESAAHNATNKIVNDPAAYAEFTFTGTALRWYGQNDTNFGKGKIYVDDQYVAYVDANGTAKYKALYGEVVGLENKEHTVRFYPEGPADSELKNNVVELDYIEVSALDSFASAEADAIETSIESATMRVGGKKTVSVFAKSGDAFVGGAYTVTVADETVADATIAGNEITITGKAAGTTKVTVAMGNFTKDIEVKVKEATAGSNKLVINNENPLLIIPVYGRAYDPNGSTLDWGDTLVGRWNSIPEDLREHAVLELHVGGIIGCKDEYTGDPNVCKDFYVQQLDIAEANDIPIMLMVATAGQHRQWTATETLDNEWLEWVIQEYDCVKGFFITENYWTSWDRVATLAADYLRIAAENGGYVIWSEHHTNVLQGIMQNEAFAAALELYGKNFAFTWKNTPASSQQNAGSAATIQGLWLNGNIDQWGGLADTWKWWELQLGKLFDSRGVYVGDGQGEEARAIVMEPEAMLGMEMLSIYANGGTIYNFEHPAYVYGSYDKTSPAFSNAVAETFRYILENPAPTKEEILADTEVILHGNVPNSFYTGLTSDYQASPTYKTGRYNLAPNVPEAVTVDTAIADKVVEYSSLSGNKVDYYNSKYEAEYTGSAFAQKVEDVWVLYNSLFNEQGTQDATVAVADQSVKVDMTEHTFTLMKEEKDGINVYLNNYRVNKDSVWEGVTAGTTNWNTDVNTLLQDWVRDWYCNDASRADGEDTFRTTTYTLTGLEAAPTVSVVRGLEGGYNTPVVKYEEGTATIEITCNGYVEFTITPNEAGEDGGVTNKSELAETIQKAEEAKKEPEGGSIVFDEDSKKAYDAAKAKADKVHADLNATQKEIDDADAALNEAIAGLASAAVIPDNDEAVAEEADEFIADILVAGDYKGEPEVHQYMIKATDNFVVSAEKPAIMKIPVAGIERGDIVVILHKDSVKNAWVNMADAIVEVNFDEDYVLCKFENFSPVLAYVMQLADTTEAKKHLKEQISEAEALKEENYSPETWKVLEKAIKEAKDILNDDSATWSELEKAADAVKDAIAGLKAPTSDDNKTSSNSGTSGSKGSADKKALKKAIKKAEKLNEADYTWYSWDEIEDALEKAKEVYDDKGATQGEVDKAVALLNAAFNSLQYASKLVEVSAPAGTTPVKTGDSASIGLMVELLGIAAAAFVIVNYKKKRS